MIFPIEKHTEMLTAAARQLEHPDGPIDDAALGWLVALGYTNEGGTPTDPDAAGNRVALLRLLGRCSECFFLQSVRAPGGVFLGAVVDPDRFAGVNGPRGGASGRGANLQQAFESCAGEAAEYLSFQEWDEKAECQDTTVLDRPLREWALAGIGLASDTSVDRLDWIEAQPLTGQRPALFPLELAVRRDTGRSTGTRRAASTGLAAGPTRNEALFSGLLEAIERDAVALWWWGGRTPRMVDPQIIEDPMYTGFVSGLRQDARRRTWFLDLTTEIDVPVIAALSSNDDGSSALAGFAAHPDIAQAARRAFAELCQMELAQDFSIAKSRQLDAEQLQEQDRIWLERHEKLHCAAFPALTQAGPALKRQPPVNPDSSFVLRQLRSAGFEAWYIDLTREAVGVPVAKVLIPGLQAADPKWITERLANTARHAVDPTEIAPI